MAPLARCCIPLLQRLAGGSRACWGAAAASQLARCITSTPSRPPALRKLLVANRGEIACRVLATARRLGIPTVAVFSDADRHAKFVGLADEAFCIGPAAARDSYLRGDTILSVASSAGVDAIHPGYGFLSENADFAEACAKAGIAFVGPPASAIRSMGDKAASKAIMSAAGVPVVPGWHGDEQDEQRLIAEAACVGFPLLVKAVAGGGGKGMKLAASEAELPAAIASARREAAASFGNDRLLLERYITRPRHVEVQVMADRHGTVLYLFDRDCSVQRRHQKIIEEAPAPGLPPELHVQLGEAAVRAARAVGYVSAGTVEFMLDVDSSEIFFLEMNTRLQVEHPVTEAVTGLDLVELQLRVAAGEALPLSQRQLNEAGPQGHSFEARLYAENTRRGFLPGAGKAVRWRTPPGAGAFDHTAAVRVDSGVSEGDAVGTNYDPMIAKVVVHGPDREAALALLRQALAQTQIAGLPTNLGFLQDLAAHPAFSALELDTGFIERHRASLLGPAEPPAELAAAAAALWSRLQQVPAPAASGIMAAWHLGDSKRLWHNLSRPLALRPAEADEALQMRLTYTGADSYEVEVVAGQPSLPVRHLQLAGDGAWSAEVAGKRLQGDALLFHQAGEQVLMLWVGGRAHEFRRAIPVWSKAVEAAAAHGQVLSPMPGRVVKVLVADGDAVSKGQPLLVLEAMKTEHTISATVDGVVACAGRLHVGTQVEEGMELMCIEDASVGTAAAVAAAG